MTNLETQKDNIEAQKESPKELDSKSADAVNT